MCRIYRTCCTYCICWICFICCTIYILKHGLSLHMLLNSSNVLNNTVLLLRSS